MHFATIVKSNIEKICLEDVGFPSPLYSYKITRPPLQFNFNLFSIYINQVTISKLYLELIIDSIITVLISVTVPCIYVVQQVTILSFNW